VHATVGSFDPPAAPHAFIAYRISWGDWSAVRVIWSNIDGHVPQGPRALFVIRADISSCTASFDPLQSTVYLQKYIGEVWGSWSDGPSEIREEW
jgi:hypothetical protein